MQNLKNYWAYLDRYRAENKTLKMHLDENRIVFVGDSIIAGWNEYALFKENSHYINRGINGQTSSQILVRFTTDVIALQPKCIVILVGTNDIAENKGPISLEKIGLNFRSMIAVAKAHKIKIVLCSILPVTTYYWNPKIQPFEKIKALNAFLASLANNKTVFYVDFYTALEKEKNINPKFSDDGIHPNAAGYAVMSDILLKSNYF